MKMDLLSLNYNELADFVAAGGEPKYRAGQIFRWLHLGAGIDEMTDISKKTREWLKENTTVYFPKIVKKLVSAGDGTVKYLFEMSDGQLIESVVMQYKHGNTICVSSQAGCRMGCRFCASTLGGLVRNLETSELVGQIIAAQKDTGLRISNIVMMGIGEPLDNYDNVIRFIRNVNDPHGLNIGCRHISLSTCGLVDRIDRLAEEGLPITLSISLHAPDNAARSEIMPVNNKWSIEELLTCCRRYFLRTGRRISFEYTLIADKNDSPAQAEKLAEVLYKYMGEDIPFHVNLIPLNEVKERGLGRSSRESVQKYQAVLKRRGINATVRRHLGGDINASCGQLRRSGSEK